MLFACREQSNQHLTLDVERQVGKVKAHLVLDLEPVVAFKLPVLELSACVLEK